MVSFSGEEKKVKVGKVVLKCPFSNATHYSATGYCGGNFSAYLASTIAYSEHPVDRSASYFSGQVRWQYTDPRWDYRLVWPGRDPNQEPRHGMREAVGASCATHV